MQPPRLPDNEEHRLQALRELAILDTPAEERFDRLTRLVQRQFNVPVALVSLVDAERQWFKSRQGLDACETGRDISFCGHAILGRDIFEIPDALLDPRFADNPLVTGPPNIRFYAGAPLTTEDGYRIGTLCIISDQPQQLCLDEKAALRDFADCVETEINQMELHRQSSALALAQHLGEIITRVQSHFIQEPDRHRGFEVLLSDLLALTKSEYGFIGEVLRTDKDLPYLKTHAITNIGWNEETRAYFDANASQGLEFFNLKTLFGAALNSGTPVIANNPPDDPRRGGLPPEHPALKTFMGIPVHCGGQLVAIAGLANRAGGYDQALLEFLNPLLVTLGQLVAAMRINVKSQEDQAALARLSRVASQTTNGVVITDVEGRTEWVNEGFTRMTGYTLEDIRGRKPGELLQGAGTNGETVAAIRTALARGEKFEADLVNYGKDGRRYWLRIACNPLRDEEGVLQGFLAIESDITREKNDAERIRDSERRLASVIDGTRIGTWEWNVQTGDTLFNSRWAEIVGHTLEELQPISIDTWLKLAHPDDLKASGELLERHFNGELDHYDYQCRMRHKLGHWVWVHDRGTVVSWTDDGKPLLMSGTHADITEHKRAEQTLQESETRMRGLFELSPVGIALNDFETGMFIEVNDALLAPSGYTREEFLTRRYWEVTPRGYEAAETQQIQNLARAGRYGPYEKEYIRKDGSRYPVLLNGMVVSDSSGRKLIWSIIEDITERKRIERMKNEFVATVSHELRTPLTSISGALGLMASGKLGVLSGQMKQMTEVAHKNSERLTYLINDLLDMEKLLAGQMVFVMQLQPLRPLLAQSLRNNQVYADQFGVRLVLTHGCDAVQVKVDGQRLQQVLANLISNAAKFSPQGGEVTVTVDCHDDLVRVSVHDQGPGIPADFQARIFEKFSQVDASDSRQKGGTGLGLAISRELVERMGGNIGFTSVAGEGATFYFEFSLSAGDAP